MYHLVDFCCICFSNTGLLLLSTKDNEKNSLYLKLTSTVIEMNCSEITSKRMVCKKCCHSIDFIYKFRKKCLDSKTLLSNYINQLQTNNKTNGKISIQLTDFQTTSHNLKMEFLEETHNFVHTNEPAVQETEKVLQIKCNMVQKTEITPKTIKKKERNTQNQPQIAEDPIIPSQNSLQVPRKRFKPAMLKRKQKINPKIVRANGDHLVKNSLENHKETTEPQLFEQVYQVTSAAIDESKFENFVKNISLNIDDFSSTQVLLEDEYSINENEFSSSEKISLSEPSAFSSTLNKPPSAQNSSARKELSGSINVLSSPRNKLLKVRNRKNFSSKQNKFSSQVKYVSLLKNNMFGTRKGSFSAQNNASSMKKNHAENEISNECSNVWSSLNEITRVQNNFSSNQNTLPSTQNELASSKNNSTSTQNVLQNFSSNQNDISSNQNNIAQNEFSNHKNIAVNESEKDQNYFSSTDNLNAQNNSIAQNEVKSEILSPLKDEEMAQNGYRVGTHSIEHPPVDLEIDIKEEIIVKTEHDLDNSSKNVNAPIIMDEIKQEIETEEHQVTEEESDFARLDFNSEDVINMEIINSDTKDPVIASISEPIQIVTASTSQTVPEITDQLAIRYVYSLKPNSEYNDKKNHVKCDLCEKEFVNLSYLSVHKKDVHTNSDLYSCEICNKQYANKNVLFLHVYSHTGVYQYECLICGKRFIENGHLVRHLDCHKNNKYQCHVCKRLFVDDVTYKQHLQKHTCRYSYKCDICGKNYVRKGLYNKHLLLHGSDKTLNCKICHKFLPPSIDIEKHILKHYKAKTFQCTICDKSYRDKCSIDIHMHSHVPRVLSEPIDYD